MKQDSNGNNATVIQNANSNTVGDAADRSGNLPNPRVTAYTPKAVGINQKGALHRTDPDIR